MLTLATIPTDNGPERFNLRSIFDRAKAEFRAEYADDQAVIDITYRHGDIAERDFANTVECIDPERASMLARDTIEQELRSAARLSIGCMVLNVSQKRTRRTR